MKRLEVLFEQALWNSRLVFLVASLACMAMAGILLWMSTLDVLHLGHLALQYADPDIATEQHKALRVEMVGEAVKSLDGFLLAMAVLIFAFGIHELFVSPLNEAHQHALGGRILVIRSLGDLKSRLGQVITVIMVVTLFEAVLEFHADGALDLLAMAGAVLLAAGALYLNHGSANDEPH